MRIMLFSVLAIITASLMTACASVPNRAGMGILYTDVKDFTNVEYINLGTSKKGVACANNILGMVVTGDMSIEAAKKKGGITKVATVDMEGKSILGVYSTVCLVVRGE
ncbi:MAG: TRL-like family protein [Bdellovibrionales bacterium]|nr:TRL-like family protein [Bdellovibrionales bacterium]